MPCFSVGQTPFALDAKFISDLDNRCVETDLVQAFQAHVFPDLASLFECDFSSAAALNNGEVDQALADAFVHSGYAQNPDGTQQFTVVVTEKNALWLVTDTSNGAAYDVRTLTDSFGVKHLFIFHCFALAVNVNAVGQQWLISDTANAMTFEVTKPTDKNVLSVQRVVSVMPLRDEGSKRISYMDIAVETKGYIYILSKSVDGQATEYRLDIYKPDGTTLLEAPQSGINAAKLTVDQWRSLFTLNFEKLLGPNDRTEPGISE